MYNKKKHLFLGNRYKLSYMNITLVIKAGEGCFEKAHIMCSSVGIVLDIICWFE